MMKELKPGSDEAIKAGCKCPVMDNCHGYGAYRDAEGVAQYWINEDCSIHGVKK